MYLASSVNRTNGRLASLLILLLACGGGAPSDDTLAREFQGHRAEYERLLAMFQADVTLGRIAPTFTRPVNFFSGAPVPPGTPVTEARLQEYRALFARLGLEAGIEGYGAKHLIEFHRYAEGMGAGLGGRGKGFVFSDSLPPNAPVHIGCESETANCIRYRPLRGGWFLYEEHHN